eukprot:736961-Rhodomonas_salina.1
MRAFSFASPLAFPHHSPPQRPSPPQQTLPQYPTHRVAHTLPQYPTSHSAYTGLRQYQTLGSGAPGQYLVDTS